MTQYHNLIRQENKENRKKIIKETIERYIKKMTSLNESERSLLFSPI